MVAAHHETAPTDMVRLVLAGNGSSVRGVRCGQWCCAMEDCLPRDLHDNGREVGSPHLVPYFSREMDVLPSTKHFVVIGALRNASGDSRRRQLDVTGGQDGVDSSSRLPSGRRVEFSLIGSSGSLDIPWSRLVGEEPSSLTSQTANSRMLPSPAWRTRPPRPRQVGFPISPTLLGLIFPRISPTRRRSVCVPRFSPSLKVIRSAIWGKARSS